MNSRRIGRTILTAGWCLLASGVVPQPADAAAKFVLVEQDSPGEGLNDPTPTTPAGGNTGTTLGAARRQAVQFGLALWAHSIDSTVPIKVAVHFDPMGGTATSCVTGIGGPSEVYPDFVGAPRPGTWYPAALAGIDPDLIFHYVEAHDYLPPREVVEALERLADG